VLYVCIQQKKTASRRKAMRDTFGTLLSKVKIKKSKIKREQRGASQISASVKTL